MIKKYICKYFYHLIWIVYYWSSMSYLSSTSACAMSSLRYQDYRSWQGPIQRNRWHWHILSGPFQIPLFVRNQEILNDLLSIKEASFNLVSNLHHSVVNHFNFSFSSLVRFQPWLSDRYLHPYHFSRAPFNHPTQMLERTSTFSSYL